MTKNAVVENAGVDRKSGNCRSKSQGWKMPERVDCRQKVTTNKAEQILLLFEC